MQIQERDVLKKVELIASSTECEAGGVANNFTMDWNLNHLQNYNDRRMYLVLENAAFSRPLENNVNYFNVILAAEGLQLNNDLRGTSQPNTLCYLKYSKNHVGGGVMIEHAEYNLPVVCVPLNGIPDRYVKFLLLKGEKTNGLHSPALTIGAAQIFTFIDMKFALYIMKEKR